MSHAVVGFDGGENLVQSFMAPMQILDEPNSKCPSVSKGTLVAISVAVHEL